MVEQPLISIIIAVKNGEKTLRRCLESLRGQTYPNREIIVVNDGSTDGTGGIANGFAGGVTPLRVITTGGAGPSAARNEGMRAANGAFVAFTDGDCIADPHWLDELMQGFSGREDVAGVGGDQQSPDDETAFGRNVNGFMKTVGIVADYVKNEKALAETAHNPTCNVLYRKDAVVAAGAFLPGLWPGEDVELDYRLTQKGHRLLYNPRAVVFHYRPSSTKGFARMMTRYGEAQALLMRKYGVFRRIQVVPFVLTALLILYTVLLLRTPGAALLFAGAALAGAAAYYVGRTGQAGLGMHYLTLAAVTLVYWNAGFLKGLAGRKI